MKKIISLILAVLTLAAASAIPSASAGAMDFTDVGTDRWSFGAIFKAYSRGYMLGTGDGCFSPDRGLTRAEAATVVWRREGSPEPLYSSPFADVDEDAWYFDAVEWSYENGIVYGVSDDLFAPEELVTREALAAILFRYSRLCPVSVTERADLSVFSDADDADAWAIEPLGWAVEAGLIEGVGESELDPDGGATREQYAAMLERFDGTFTLSYNEPILVSHYTEKPYPLVTNADFYVSPDGDDSSDGSFSHPFASFDRAVAAVREIPKTADRGGVTVAFRAGEYGPLTVSLTAEDSGTPECPVTFCKYGDGDVVFNNGFDYPASAFEPIDGAEAELFNPRFTDRIKKIDASELFDAGLTGDKMLIFNDDGICTEARYPNKYSDGTDQLYPAASRNDGTSLKVFYSPYVKRLNAYDERVYATMGIWGHIIRGYRKDAFRIAGYDPDTQVLHVENWQDSEFGVMRDWMGVDGNGIEFCLTNISYELDFAGEYWIDPETETLYMFAPKGTYHIPGPGAMVTMDSVDDVTFRGLSFRNTTDRFITASMCHSVTLELCRFSVTMAIEGILFDDNEDDRPMDLTVRECTLENCYGHALFVNGHAIGEKKFTKKTNVVFDNNLVMRTNMLYDTWNGIHFRQCSGVTATHNRFERCSRGAISFTQSFDLMIEYNDFDSAMCDSHDGGVIYTDWIVDARDLVVRYNYFGEVPTAGTGQFGLYLDEFTSGFEIYSNLFYRTGNCTVMFSLGRDNVFRDNVMISSAIGWGTSSRLEIEDYGSVQNARANGCWGIIYGERTWFELFNNCENYPEYRAEVERRWPQMLDVHFDYDRIDDVNFALNQVTYILDNVAISRSGREFQTDRKFEQIYTTYDGNSWYPMEENPVFVNPTTGDYRIRDGVDFPDIRFELIGRY